MEEKRIGYPHIQKAQEDLIMDRMLQLEMMQILMVLGLGYIMLIAELLMHCSLMLDSSRVKL